MTDVQVSADVGVRAGRIWRTNGAAPQLGWAIRGVAAGTQSVTVYAGSAGEALRLAEKQNSGWTAISATKIAPKDPKSRQWGVKMRK